MHYDAAYDNGDQLTMGGPLYYKDPLPLSLFLILPFVIGSIAVSAMPGWNYLVIGLGALSAAVFLMASLRGGFFVPKELILFMAFFVWSIFGLFVARVPEIVTERLRTMLQLVIMAMIVSYYARNTRCVNWLFWGILVGVLIVSVGAVMTGEYARAEVVGEDTRVAGFIMNANAFSRAVCYGIAILLYFFRFTRSKILKLIIIGSIY
jgi:hypothetical protein